MVRPRHGAHGTLSGPPVSLRHLRHHSPLNRVRFTASVYPVAGAPLADGALLVEDDRIVDVGRDDVVPTPEDALLVRLSGAVILPGLVNLHTHLELTALAGRVPEDDFVEWIQHVGSAKQGLTPEDYEAGARRGVVDAWRHGTTTVADTGDSGAVVAALSELGGRGVVYQEVFGPHPDQAAGAIALLQAAVARLQGIAGPSVRVGVSPHAPYTVSEPLFRMTAAWARRERLAMAVHIAESHAEVALVTGNAGPFAEKWRGRNIPGLATARSPVAFLKAAGVLEARPLAIHAVQIDGDDAKTLADHGCPVAICPRSNRRHGHGDPPVHLIREAGLNFGIGTDSVASVDSLDLFEEARQARRLAGLTASESIALLTRDGAACLGMEGEVGVLERGMRADLLVLDMGSEPVAEPTMAERIIQATPAAILETYLDGRLVYRRAPDGASREATRDR